MANSQLHPHQHLTEASWGRVETPHFSSSLYPLAILFLKDERWQVRVLAG